MTQQSQIEDTLTDIENSSESAGVAFVDHLRTVAENGEEYATVEAMRAEAEGIMGWAKYFLDHVTSESEAQP